MYAKPLIIVLLVVIALLIGTNLFATDKVFYYQNLYRNDPQIKVENHKQIVYTPFDPDRSSAYTCVPQKVSNDGVGMVCSNPDGSITIDCTVGGTDTSKYFC